LDISSARLSSRTWAHMKHLCLPQDAQLPKSSRRGSLEPHDVFLITLPILWPISTGALLVIFAVIILSYLMSRYRGSEQESRLRVVSELASNSVDQNVLEITTLGPNALDSSLMRPRARLKTWSKVAAVAYVAMVLSSVGLYVGSRLLGLSSPSWCPIALAGINLGSTYLAYRVWSKAREE
jgi:hypothetical protein